MSTEQLFKSREQRSVAEKKANNNQVSIKRIESRFVLASKHNVGCKDILDEANMALGSFIDRVTNKPYRALDPTEEKYIMPALVGVEYGSTDFYNKVEEYYADMHENIPAEGKVLNIGGSKRVVKNIAGQDETIFIPDSPVDWIIYRHCLEYFKVAKSNSEKDLQERDGAQYYISDTAFEDTEKFETVKLKQEANKKFLDLTYGDKVAESNKETLGFIFRLTKASHLKTVKDIRDVTGKVDIGKLVTILNTVVEKDPTLFINTAQDDLLEYKSLLYRAVECGVLNKIGNSYFDNQEEIGTNDEKAIQYMNSENNSGYKTELLARIKEKEKLIK